MEYNFREIEIKWQQYWDTENIYKVKIDQNKTKCYVLDMFPYPSGAGLHVGHPLGYIASDIYARFKRLKGFNVLHPMGFDSFGLPAEQYAIETGQHPATTTEKNIETFKKQLAKIGFCFDWSREVRTSDASYYKWTQTIFLELFNSYYDRASNKAKPIAALIDAFATKGSENFTAAEWQAFSNIEKADILMSYRLAFSKYGEVNWCEALGTVLANDEIVNGVSERGGYPVVKKKMRQWYLRITDYAERLLEGLETVDFSDSMKEMQRNWIGKSVGAEISFAIKTTTPTQTESEIQENALQFTVFTTRPDTIFGVDFMVAAPELDWISNIVTSEQRQIFDEYVAYVKSRSEVERMAEKKITGCFTGAYAINPLNGREIPIWVSEYVLAGYGTGAIMAVPCGDERDFKFAQYFKIPITNIIGDAFNGKEANPTKEQAYTNSDFVNGMKYVEASAAIIEKLEAMGAGKAKINFKMRDAGFSRQRYWGEPFPIIWQNRIAIPLDKKDLPLALPHLEKYEPGPEGQGPLANSAAWSSKNYEVNTMPGYAGSSWYFLRYMDPDNDNSFCSREASDYWSQVDLYIGGTEHAVGHLLYSRMWTKVLYDLGYISFDEPFKRLVNQGMITGSSRFVYRINGKNTLVSKELVENEEFYKGQKVDKLHVDVNFVDGVELDTEAFKKWKNGEYANAEFIVGESGKYICGVETEKMSKSKYNTVNPDDLCDKYGADTFRMYEMFLGPVEMSKPWDTKGIEGVHRFLKKLWRLFYDEQKGWIVTDEVPTNAEWKVLHKTIKKVEEDTEKLAYNTAVSAFMIAVNELTELKCNKQEILKPLLIILAPYAPHITEELFQKINNRQHSSIVDATYPTFDAKYLLESSKEYPVSINGKMRTTVQLPLDLSAEEVEKIILENEIVLKWMEGKPLKKLIFVKGKMINVVI
jgi:leucyl-tRNA synthetase